MTFQTQSPRAVAPLVAPAGTVCGAASSPVNLAAVSDFPAVVSLFRGRQAAGLLALVIVKQFARGVASSTGYALRLGAVGRDTRVVLVCVGYRTGRVLREAMNRECPVYITGCAELLPLTKMLRATHRSARLLICADDDGSADVSTSQPSCRAIARAVAENTRRCDFVWPVFDERLRRPGDCSFSDLGIRQGLPIVARQLQFVVSALDRSPAGAR